MNLCPSNYTHPLATTAPTKPGRLIDDLGSYVIARLDKLDEQAREVKTSAIKLMVSVATYGDADVHAKVIERYLPHLLTVPADRLMTEIRRAVAEVYKWSI